MISRRPRPHWRAGRPGDTGTQDTRLHRPHTSSLHAATPSTAGPPHPGARLDRRARRTGAWHLAELESDQASALSKALRPHPLPLPLPHSQHTSECRALQPLTHPQLLSLHAA